MIIGIIGSVEQEVFFLRKQLTCTCTWQRAGCKIYCGQLNNIDVLLVQSGVGKVLAALSTTLLLDNFKPDVIISIGSAGGIVPWLKIGDIVVSHEVRYHDVDVTTFGYEPGQMAQCPASFITASSLIMQAKQAMTHLDGRYYAVYGLIVSGDVFINKDTLALSHIRQHFPKAIAVEMESAAIAHICHQFSIPFIAVRSISDITEQEQEASYLDFNKYLTMAAQRSSRLVIEMIRLLTH